MTKILACGDVHLGQGAERYGPQRLADQAQVWGRVADIALEERVDLVAFAGDAFERRRYPSQAELVAFAKPLRRLHAQGIPVVAIPGNHDYLAPDVPSSLEVFSDLMHVVSVPQVVKAGGVSVGCLPWTPISRLVASRNGGDRDALYAEAAALLHAAARGLRAEITDGPAVLLAHWSVSGAVTPTGREVGLDFGVVLDCAELEAMGWDAVILAHIHRKQVLCDQPWMGYTSTPIPHDFGEEDTEHGVWILDVEQGSCEARFVEIPSRPFVTVDLDPVEAQEISDSATGLYWPAQIVGAIVRLRCQPTAEQARRISGAAIEAAARKAGAFHAKYEPEIVREDRARVHIDADQLTELDALQLYLDANALNGTRGALMVERTSRYLQEQRQ